MVSKSNDDSSLSHTRWNCKYHNTPEIGSIKFYGLSEKEVIANDIRKTYEFKI